jgi:hypothetical protein
VAETDIAPVGLRRQVREAWPSGAGGIVLACVLAVLWPLAALALCILVNVLVGLAFFFSPLLLFRR